MDNFELVEKKEDFCLTASRMVPYKRIPLIIEAFAAMPDRRLVVIGDGPEFEKAKAKAGPNVELLGYQDDVVLKSCLQRARAFVFAAEEDFGIVPVEAQACGTPVLAYGRGAARETIVDGVTGLFFDQQTVPAIVEAVRRFEAIPKGFNAALIRKNAERFSGDRFKKEFLYLVRERTA